MLRVAALGDAGQPGELPAGAPPDLAEAALRKLLLQRVAADLVPAARCRRRDSSELLDIGWQAMYATLSALRLMTVLQ